MTNTPDNEAYELTKKFWSSSSPLKRISWHVATKLAIICVEREIELLKQLIKPEYTTFATDYENGATLDGYEYIEEKESVLNELKAKL